MTPKLRLLKFRAKECWSGIIEKFRFAKRRAFGKENHIFKQDAIRLPALKYIAVTSAIVIIIAAGIFFSGKRATAGFGKEFQAYAGQEVEIDGLRLKLESVIFPACESGADCRSIGSAITVTSQGKSLESRVFSGIEKDFFIVDKKIGVNLTETVGGSAKFIVTLKG